jgi:hypothetical protein
MGQRERSDRRFWTGAIVIGGLLLVAMIGYSLNRPSPATAQAPTLPQLNVLYLADPTNAALDHARAQAYGVRIVSSVSDLMTGAPTAAVIIIDKRYFSDVSADWQAAQIAAGRVIVGLNVPSDRLEHIRGYRQPGRANTFRQDWGGRPFYSLVYQRHSANGALLVGEMSDHITTTDGFFATLYGILKNVPAPTAPQQ